MATATVDESVELDAALREEVCRMKRTLQYGDYQRLPKGVVAFVRDLCRAEPRVIHPLGQYPHVVDAFAGVGVPWPDLFGPVNHLKGVIWQKYFAVSLPCIGEAVSRETEANNQQNHATHRLLKSPRQDTLDAFVEACDVQIAETRLARQVAVAMKEGFR
jgi:hypothetical protein